MSVLERHFLINGHEITAINYELQYDPSSRLPKVAKANLVFLNHKTEVVRLLGLDRLQLANVVGQYNFPSIECGVGANPFNTSDTHVIGRLEGDDLSPGRFFTNAGNHNHCHFQLPEKLNERSTATKPSN